MTMISPSKTGISPSKTRSFCQKKWGIHHLKWGLNDEHRDFTMNKRVFSIYEDSTWGLQ